MNQRRLACRVLMAITACAMPQNVAMGQTTCPCQTNPNLAGPLLPTLVEPQFRMTVQSRLPESWPRQWGDPVSTESTSSIAKSALKNKPQGSDAVTGKQDSQNTSSMNRHARTRDPFTGEWVAAGSQTRWSKTDQTGKPSDSSQRLASADEPSKSTSTTSDKSASGSKTPDTSTSGFSSSAAYGGGSSSGGSGGGSGGSFGGGMSGGNSGGLSGGSTWIPRTSGTGGGTSGGFGGGGGSNSGFLSQSETASGSSSTSPVVASIPEPASIPDPDPGNGGGLAEIPPPHCPVPPLLPDIPSTGGDPESPTDLNPGNGIGEAPIVPEPGSIVLLSIAMGIGGASYLRRRRAGTPAPASAHSAME